MSGLTFTVQHRPLSWKRTTGRGGQRYTTPEQRAYQELLAYHAMQAVGKAKRAGVRWPLDAECYALTCVFWMPDRRLVDVDNLAKNVMDACQSVLWNNDSRVASLMAVRGYDPADARTVVSVVAHDQRRHEAALAGLILRGVA